jgi:hypothetical protein
MQPLLAAALTTPAAAAASLLFSHDRVQERTASFVHADALRSTKLLPLATYSTCCCC